MLLILFLIFACSEDDGGRLADGDSDTTESESQEEGESEIVNLWADCRPNTQEFPVRPTPEESATLPLLHVEGRDIVNESGEKVMLRGANFGSWMMMETWIAGIGLLFEWDFLKQIEPKAEEFGVAELVQEAREQTSFEWLLEETSHWELSQRWKPYTYEHAEPDQIDGLDDFWAWFESEPWIFEERSLWKYLDSRFGHEKTEELRRTFQDHYITEVDVERHAGLGLNLIRVPFWYEALETDRDGENAFKTEGWERLDRLVTWARKHEVYLMLDMHGAPGGQSTSWHQGLENGGFLWTNRECIDKTVRLWSAIARYFKDEPHIAIFNLLNEPMAAPDKETYASVHDEIYQAIRAEDTRHIVMIDDGYKSTEFLTSPKEMCWENAMFSLHLYPGGGSPDEYLGNIDNELKTFDDAFERFDCPIYIGEFNAADGNDGSPDMAAEAMGLVLDRLNRRGLHWGFWTWKYYSDTSIWGLYHPAEHPGTRIDVKDASFEKIKADFEALNSTNFTANAAFYKVVGDHAAAAHVPVNLGSLD